MSEQGKSGVRLCPLQRWGLLRDLCCPDAEIPKEGREEAESVWFFHEVCAQGRGLSSVACRGDCVSNAHPIWGIEHTGQCGGNLETGALGMLTAVEIPLAISFGVLNCNHPRLGNQRKTQVK